jgi:hypothetical protein
MTQERWACLSAAVVAFAWGVYCLRVSRDPEGTWGGRALVSFYDVLRGSWSAEPQVRLRRDATIGFGLAAVFVILCVFAPESPRP